MTENEMNLSSLYNWRLILSSKHTDIHRLSRMLGLSTIIDVDKELERVNKLIIRQTSVSDKDLLTILGVDDIITFDKTERELLIKNGELITEYEEEK